MLIENSSILNLPLESKRQIKEGIFFKGTPKKVEIWKIVVKFKSIWGKLKSLKLKKKMEKK